jgi:acetoin utilization protein AcuB
VGGPVTIETIMTRHVMTIGLDAKLAEVRVIFIKEKFHHLIVVNGPKAVGVISDRDLSRHLSPFVGKYAERSQDKQTLERRVHQVMSRKFDWVKPGATIREAVELLLNKNVSCLPVLDEYEHVKGVVTWRDLLPWTLAALEKCEARAA